MKEIRQMTPKPKILEPSLDLLPFYKKTLLTGWSPTTINPDAKRHEQLKHIHNDPNGFVAELNCLEPSPESKRIPNHNYWLFHNNEFAGNLSFRWQPGTNALPPTCLGHIGYNITPKFQGKGWASWTLKQILPTAWEKGLTWVDITCDPSNLASQKTAKNAGAQFVEALSLGAPFHKDIFLFRLKK